ncbi:McKusick-Kaufman/Bardet-Biedl syndromes putative chaperonin isoform X2 [Cyclopterus lumpus]|uniref:McKusick-Kaufman/Bardet-Biedl syndromes putative chaperonin isoform X2 n=1 Tax=Cyclopterus lumpus TaxID=8103 RepID=UPI001485FE87|nr:McKusick-Kaufman/Bardet-Biedl syndromes putative chaperonin isoform X2 [Cyclopterus lumpus]
MSRLDKKSPSVCTDLPLDNTDICNKLHLLKQLLKSCFGPTGRLKQVHNNIGGHVVTTSTSSVLLPAISSSQPFINLIKTSILNHVSRFSDCGLLVDALDVLLVDGSESAHSNPLRVVVFSASLAGDLAELGDGTIDVHPGADTDSQILDQLLELGKRVVRDEVKLCACQKVVHPVLQHYLQSHGVVVIERLGIALMEPLAQLTGAQPVATLHTTIPARAYGKVRGLSVKPFGSKTMLHLHPSGESSICTMILCHRNETMLSELKVACQKTEHVLGLTLREPSALLGGGCTETHLAAYVRHKSMKEVPETVSALGCSQTELLRGVDGFCQSLESVAAALEHDGGDSFMDLTHAHHWTHPADCLKGLVEEDSSGVCGCGLMESSPNQKWTYLNTNCPQFSPAPLSRDAAVQPRVLDSFTAKLNALQVAVETANLALDVRYLIQDMN